VKQIEVRENELFVRKGFFPYHAECLIKEGDELRFGDPIARAIVFDKISKVSWDGQISNSRGASVKIGATVKKGDVLVEKTGVFSRPLNSPCDGRVVSITSSAIYIEEGRLFETFKTPFMGQVRGVNPGYYEVEMFGDAIQGVWGNEANAQGLWRLANIQPYSEPNTLVAVEGELNEDDLLELFDREHEGFVLAGINAALAPRIIHSKKAVVLLCGFGATSFAPPVRRLLANNAGKPAIISGRIEDRLHAVFPEIIFPRSRQLISQKPALIFKDKDLVMVCSLTGTTRIGTISKSSQGRVKLGSGIQDHVVEVLFQDGSREIIPRSQIKKVV